MGDRDAILIVDSNIGFATMLKQSLEQDGEYRATIAHSGSEALAIASRDTFDLAIVDLGIDATDDLEGSAVARRLRAEHSDLRLTLIPLEGDVLPEDMADLDVQTVLPKPFFLPDLPGLIEEALAQPMEGSTQIGEPEDLSLPAEPDEPGDQVATAAEPIAAPRAGSPDVTEALKELAREVNAEAVLLTHEAGTLASVGQLSAEQFGQLAQIIRESYRNSSQLAEILGREPRRFEQSLEGGEYIVYATTVVDDVILSVALPGDVALGIVRHRTRTVAKRLRSLADPPW